MYDVDSELFGVQGRLGWQSKSFFGAEVEGSFGLSDDDATVVVGGVPLMAETGVDTQIAGFGVARLPVSERLNILGRVGYHKTDFSGEVTDGVTVADLDFSTDGIAYGAGVEYALGQKTSVRADYTRYDFDGADADSVSLAIARKF
jgi:opacity protein-like surface antigen